MPRYLLQPVWNQSSTGWTEAYVTKQISAGNLSAVATNLVVLRTNLLYASYHNWLGLRVGVLPTDLNVEAARRRSRVYLVGENDLDEGGKLVIPATGSRTVVEGAVETPDQIRAALQMRCKFDDDRSTIRYLAAIADGVSVTEPGTFTFARNVDWGNRWKQFRDWMAANTDIIALLNAGDHAPVQSAKLTLEAAAPGRLIVHVLTASAKNIVAGEKVLISGFRRKAEMPGISLNGTYYVDAVSTTLVTSYTSYTLRGTEGQNPDSWKILGTVRKKGYGYFSIQKVDPYRVGIHKRGRPTLAPRGRRLTRRSLDP